MKDLAARGGDWSKRFGKTGLTALAQLFLSRGCAVCDRPTPKFFCIDCQRQIAQQQSSPLPTTNKASDRLPVIASGLYGGSLKRAILAMKYSDRPDVAQPLGAALAQHWRIYQSDSLKRRTANRSAASRLYAVPIPLHAERQKRRGYNQAELIADSFCRVSGMPSLAHGLVRSQATKPQHELNLTARQQNLSQVFEVGPSLHNAAQVLTKKSNGRLKASVLLIDDIYTTGATAQSAAATLQQAGFAVAGIATVARAALQ